jgi:L-lactate dehydrogenase
VQEGAFGLTDVALSLPAIVGRDGASTVLTPEMNDDERSRLSDSAAVLRSAIAAIGG